MFPFPTFRPNVSYEDTLSWALNANSSDNAGYTLVQTITAAIIPRDGSSFIITFESGSSTLKISGAYIGEQAGSGDAYDFAGTPTQITFDTGAAFFEIASGSTKASDLITFAIDETKTYLVAFQMSDAGKGYLKQTNDGAQNTDNYYKASGSDAATVNKSGYTGPGANQFGIKSIVIYGP